jgi:HPt (histidine-containing phosphotransfer) domain-containing protein
MMYDPVEKSHEPIDRSVLASLRELQEAGEPDIVAEVGSLFLKHTPQKIDAIGKAIALKDAKALEVAAHGLKSSSSYIGAMTLSAISKELEFMGRNSAFEGALAKAAQAENEFERVKAALESEINRKIM